MPAQRGPALSCFGGHLVWNAMALREPSPRQQLVRSTLGCMPRSLGGTPSFADAVFSRAVRWSHGLDSLTEGHSAHGSVALLVHLRYFAQDGPLRRGRPLAAWSLGGWLLRLRILP